MKRQFNMLVLFILSICPQLIYTQSTANFVFDITPENKEYLRYLLIYNQFDSAKVILQLGEFRIVSNGQTSRINIKRSFDESFQVQGDSTFGTDYKLQSYARTVDFPMPANGTVKYFRYLSVSLDCDKDYPIESPDDGGDGTWRDFYWTVGKNYIQDKSEFLIELVRSSDNTPIFVIDSFGVDQNPNSNIAQRYGMETTVMNHERQLPQGFAGTNCYIRVTPRRWGDTPYGMMLQVYPCWFSQSEAMEYDSTLTKLYFKFDSINVKRIDTAYAEQIINYTDSVKNATGFVPDLTGCPHLANWDSVVNSRYFEKKVIIRYGQYDTLWVEKVDSIYLQKAPRVLSGMKLNEFQFKILSVNPNPVTKEAITIEILSFIDRSIRISLFDLHGKSINNLWQGAINKGGTNKITLPFPKISEGTYLIGVTDLQDAILDKHKIIVQY